MSELSQSKFRCFFVSKQDDKVERGIQTKSIDDLPAGDVLVRIKYSAVNYKDGLAAAGHPGVALNLPTIPGIDAVGTVVESSDDSILPGQDVMISGADFGTASWGGWAELARVPASYCIRVPSEMTPRQAAIIGTAGFTAAQSLLKIQHHGIQPDQGPVVVTGATGGVGIFAVSLLSQAGYHVVASTGKSDRHTWLKELGAKEVVSREDVADDSKRPLLSAKWAAGIDTVGGNPLSSVLRATKPGGCVTTCGLVADHKFAMTVYPFILRGVGLLGVDSANASVPFRHELWQRLATDLMPKNLESLVTEVPLTNVEDSVTDVLAGKIAGRHLITI